MNVLISGVGGPTPRSVARSIRYYSNYSESTLIGTDCDPLAHGLYQTSLYDATHVVPPAGSPDYWPAIQQIVDTHGIDLALIHPEQEVLEWVARRERGEALPCPALLPDRGIAELLTDKAAMSRALAGTPFIPPTLEVIPGQTTTEQLGAQLGYPFWVRAARGSSGAGSYKVDNAAAFDRWIAMNPATKSFLASRYLPGRNLACKLLYHDGRLVRAASAERVEYIMSRTAPSGITGNTRFGRLLNHPALVERSAQILDRLFRETGSRPHGFFTADFKEDAQGRPMLTEINIRMVAFNLSFAAAGANFTQDTLRLLTGDPGFDSAFHEYRFTPGTIFLRDVDGDPILMNEADLKPHFAPARPISTPLSATISAP